ncbi:MAG: CPBP family intramembrane metalloprotease [Lachnospiraceae bacterium]|nr:CPBP family intramembrane metalloprotease [Lachnospiraceae bacterium]
MNSKKANWAFLITIVVYVGAALSVSKFMPFIADNLVLGNLFSEVVTLLPILIFTLVSKEKLGTFLGFHKIKFRSILMIGLFTFLSSPVLSLISLVSQIWVDNEVGIILEEQQSQLPFALMFLTVAIIAPVFEEIICRGAYYRSYCKSGSAFKAMIMSAIIFAFIHMNFNQAAYAFVMGIFAVLLVEATGSLWASILYHGFFNGGQVILLYTTLAENTDAYNEPTTLTTNFLLYGIGLYLFLAAVTLPLAWAVLIWIGQTEGRSAVLSGIWSQKKEKKDKMVTVPFVLALILCLAIMTGLLYVFVSQILQLILP